MITINLKDPNWDSLLIEDLKKNQINYIKSNSSCHFFNYLRKRFTIVYKGNDGRSLFEYSSTSNHLTEFIKSSKYFIEIDIDGFKKKIDGLEEKIKERKASINILSVQSIFMESEILSILENIDPSYKFLKSENNLSKNKTLDIYFEMFETVFNLYLDANISMNQLKDFDIKLLRWRLFDCYCEKDYDGVIDYRSYDVILSDKFEIIIERLKTLSEKVKIKQEEHKNNKDHIKKLKIDLEEKQKEKEKFEYLLEKIENEKDKILQKLIDMKSAEEIFVKRILSGYKNDHN